MFLTMAGGYGPWYNLKAFADHKLKMAETAKLVLGEMLVTSNFSFNHGFLLSCYVQCSPFYCLGPAWLSAKEFDS